MKTPPCDCGRVSDGDGVSRRAVMGAGAAGLALAMLARNLTVVAAQDATPEAEGGMPTGLSVISLTNIPVPGADIPVDGFIISVTRVTLEPGTDVPVGSFPYPTSGFVESGTLTCPGEAPRFLITADGTVKEVGAGDITVNAGEALYIPPNVPDGARNDGTELLSVLLIDLVSTAGMGTPAA